MTETIRARHAADFLALVPQLAGYTPSHSVVLVPFRGTLSAGLLRCDLPAGDIDAFASTAIGMVCRLPDVDGVAIVVYDDTPWLGGAHADVVEALLVRADACGLHVGDALGVMADGWGRYFDDAPRPARPLTEIVVPPLPISLARPGDQATDAHLALAPDDARADVAAAVASVDDALRAVCGDGAGARGAVVGVNPHALEAIDALDESGRLWEDALRWVRFGDGPLPPYRAAVLLWTLSRPGLRDVALTQWCHGVEAGAHALEDQLRWEAGEPYPDGPLFLAGEGPRPDRTRLSDARQLAVELASLAEGAHRAAALATAAWLSWAMGSGTHADVYAHAALAIDPAHGLAGIVSALACDGRLPEWAFTEDAA